MKRIWMSRWLRHWVCVSSIVSFCIWTSYRFRQTRCTNSVSRFCEPSLHHVSMDSDTKYNIHYRCFCSRTGLLLSNTEWPILAITTTCRRRLVRKCDTLHLLSISYLQAIAEPRRKRISMTNSITAAPLFNQDMALLSWKGVLWLSPDQVVPLASE